MKIVVKVARSWVSKYLNIFKTVKFMKMELLSKSQKVL